VPIIDIPHPCREQNRAGGESDNYPAVIDIDQDYPTAGIGPRNDGDDTKEEDIAAGGSIRPSRALRM